MSKQDKPRAVTTPRGTAVWPHLHAPDTKFDAAGVYTVKLKLSAEEGEKLIALYRAELPKAQAMGKEEAKGKKFALREEAWDENEDGTFTFSFKMKASGTRKDKTTWTRKPALFDSRGKPLPAGTRVGGGSEIRVAAELVPYYNAAQKQAGLSWRLTAVQVIELRAFGERDADSFGFEEEEGFSADDLATSGAFPAADEGAEADDADERDDDTEDDGDF